MSEPSEHITAPTGRQRPARAVVITRIVLVVYIVALTTGTHWPRLQLGTEDFYAPDKLVHWLAFGGLALLFWASGWIAGAAAFGVVMLLWAGADELTQAFPGLGRTISWLDLLASMLGVLTVVAWRLALRPIGGVANRARLGLDQLAWQHALSTPWRWLIIGGAGVLGAALVWPVASRVRDVDVATVLGAAAMGALLVALAAAEGLRRHAWRRLARKRACCQCGRSCADVPTDQTDRLVCPRCGRVQWGGQWQGLSLDRWRLISLLIGPVLLSLTIYACLLALYSLAVVMHGSWPVAGRLNRLYNGLPPDLQLVIELTILHIVAAAGVARFRIDLARRIDKADRTCLTCGHDLRGMVLESGVGRCSECGRLVVPMPDPPPCDMSTE